MGTDRENIVPGNLCIIEKLNEAWPLKGVDHCLTTHKGFNTEKKTPSLLRLLKFLIPKKDSITFLQLLKFLILEKDSITYLGLLKVSILKNDYITFLRLKVS